MQKLEQRKEIFFFITYNQSRSDKCEKPKNNPHHDNTALFAGVETEKTNIGKWRGKSTPSLENSVFKKDEETALNDAHCFYCCFLESIVFYFVWILTVLEPVTNPIECQWILFPLLYFLFSSSANFPSLLLAYVKVVSTGWKIIVSFVWIYKHFLLSFFFLRRLRIIRKLIISNIFLKS